MVGTGQQISDCNNIPIGSVAYARYGATNAPFSDSSANIISFGLEGHYMQIAFKVSSPCAIKVRNYDNSQWYNWIAIST